MYITCVTVHESTLYAEPIKKNLEWHAHTTGLPTAMVCLVSYYTLENAIYKCNSYYLHIISN